LGSTSATAFRPDYIQEKQKSFNPFDHDQEESKEDNDNFTLFDDMNSSKIQPNSVRQNKQNEHLNQRRLSKEELLFVADMDAIPQQVPQPKHGTNGNLSQAFDVFKPHEQQIPLPNHQGTKGSNNLQQLLHVLKQNPQQSYQGPQQGYQMQTPSNQNSNQVYGYNPSTVAMPSPTNHMTGMMQSAAIFPVPPQIHNGYIANQQQAHPSKMQTF